MFRENSLSNTFLTTLTQEKLAQWLMAQIFDEYKWQEVTDKAIILSCKILILFRKKETSDTIQISIDLRIHQVIFRA